MFQETRSWVKILHQYKGAFKLNCFDRRIGAYSMFQFQIRKILIKLTKININL